MVLPVCAHVAEPAERCQVSAFRGALRAGGATATMTVINDGGSCAITNYVDVESRTRPDTLRTVTRPQNGSLKISQPATISYRPSPGFVGSDEFVYSGTGRSPAGRLVELLVTVSVTVLPVAAPEPRP